VERTPLMLVGDSPAEPTGLGRILRDLGWQIHASDLPVELVSVGGCVPPVWPHWPHYALDERLQRGDDWGASYVAALWRSHFGERPGIIWLIWDPGRLAYYRDLQVPAQIWSYPALDATNGAGSIGGAAGMALRGVDRLIAYGRWASQKFRPMRSEPVPYLPHGLSLAAAGDVGDALATWARQRLGPYVAREDMVLGCVATNQSRKDLGLFFQTLSELRTRGHKVYGWLHTDVLEKAWSVPQLIEDFGLARRVMVSYAHLTDRQLAALYQQCAATVAVGLGEGFGYPIVESLANGTPVLHGDCAGGRELVPKREWRFPVRELRLEGTYGLERPVFRASDVVNAFERVMAWRQAVGEAVAVDYCRGAVAHLDWESLWPRWRSWVRAGL
jgi:glycosyltransferase involved in cell wall biosynthesis